MSQSFGVREAVGGGQARWVAPSLTLVQAARRGASGSMHARLLQLHAGLVAGALRGGPFWKALAGGREQLESVLPHLVHRGGAVEEPGELLRDLPVLPLRGVLALAAAAPPVVLKWTEREIKN